MRWIGITRRNSKNDFRDLSNKEKWNMKHFNLNTFNDILKTALKDQSPKGKLELIEAELNMIGDMLFGEMAELMDELEKAGYKSERFSRIMNIKNNTEGLVMEAEELRKQIKEESNAKDPC